MNTNKTLLIYPGFIIAFLLVVVVFISATTYTQLSIAILLYPVLAFFAYQVFLGKKQVSKTTIKASLKNIPAQTVTEKMETQTDSRGITDIDKRTFLKLIGATGISFFLISVFGRRVESLIFGGQNPAQTGASIGNSPVDKTSAAATSPTDGYNISEVDEDIISYYGFINKDGGWFIMKGDTDTGSFRYVRGKSNFPDNWKKRQNLEYDYFYQVFP